MAATKLKGNAVIGQSGGPTSVINSSLAGVLETALKSKKIGKVFGMNFGIEGFMEERLIDLGAQAKKILPGLRRTPSSALGSTRHKVKEEDFPKIMAVLKKFNIRYFFLIGGNDSMDTVNRVESYCRKSGYELTGVGIPKTVDNDLFGTDHTPGFPSAARYNILSAMQSGWLFRDMKRVDQYVVYQTIGRDAGWLAAATALAKRKEDDAPHLIYVPECVFEKEKFLSDVETCVKKYGWVSIVCGEGIKYADGTPVSASETRDKFSNIEFGAVGGASAGLNLHRMIKEKFGYRGEFQITESLPMCAMDRAVTNDLREAFQCGAEAVKLAEKGESGYMVSMTRAAGKKYKVGFSKVPLKDVAVHAKPMPKDFLNATGNFPTEKFLQYLRPLVGELPDYIEIDKKIAKP